MDNEQVTTELFYNMLKILKLTNLEYHFILQKIHLVNYVRLNYFYQKKLVLNF